MRAKLNKYLLGTIIVLSCTIFAWTINTIIVSQSNYVPTAISAFSA